MPVSERILVTGADGFIGSRLCGHLRSLGFVVRAAQRRQRIPQPGVETVVIGDLGADTDWREALDGVGIVVHLAACAESGNSTQDIEQCRTVNVSGTARLARESARVGVRQLLFLSSIKVTGEQTEPGQAVTAFHPGAPQGPYAISKRDAERELARLAQETGLAVTVVRPPLVYGPGVKGNLLRLLRWIDRETVIPLGAVRNERSLIGLDNLVEFVAACLERQATGVYTVADDEHPSVPDVIRILAEAMGRRPRLLPVPLPLLRLGATIGGKGAACASLCDSLVVDSQAAKQALGWTPRVELAEGLKKMADWYGERARGAR